MDNKITPLFSIIMPCYNSSKSVKKTIRLILDQSFNDFELIVIDDGSTDNTFQIVKDFALNDQRIRLFKQSNLGAATARNTGLNYANGDWIAFCDSDDEVRKDWLKSFYDNILPNSDMLSQGYLTDTGQKVVLPNYVYERDSFKEWLEQGYKGFLWGFLWCKAFKSEIIKENNLVFSSHLSFQEDLEFILHYLEFSKNIVQINSTEYIYVGNGDVSKYKNYRKLDGAILCIEHIKKIMNQEDGLLIEYFQRLMIEDIFLGYCQNDTQKNRISNILKFKHIVGNELRWQNCSGCSRKLFYLFYSYLPISFMDKGLMLLNKLYVIKN